MRQQTGQAKLLTIDSAAAIAGLSPVQKMELADVLYDTAIQELDALATSLSTPQLAEIDRSIGVVQAGQRVFEPWDGFYQRLRHAV